MMFDAIRKLISWLKEILRLGRVRPNNSKKELTTVIAAGEEPVNAIQKKDKEGEEVTLCKGRIAPADKRKERDRTVAQQSVEEVPIAEGSQEVRPPMGKERTEKGTEAKRPSEGAQFEPDHIEGWQKGIPTKRPSRIKKSPTAVSQVRKSQTHKKEPRDNRRGKHIDLGDKKTKRRKTTKFSSQAQVDTHFHKREEAQDKGQVATRIESPSVELSVDEAKVFLVLPEQKLLAGSTAPDIHRGLIYSLQINGEEHSVSAKVSKDNDGLRKVEEKRVELECCLEEFRGAFPPELGGSLYTYKHKNMAFYTFVAIGSNRGRMYYLYDEDGNINPLPKRMVWLLLDEDFKLENVSNYLTEETWIWDKHRPFRVNLKEINQLVIKNAKTSKEYKLPCQPTFSIEGQVIEDDFKEEMPLLIGESLKIKAPRENLYGWTVWIQNKIAGYRIITENWSGTEPLSLKLPDDLPCECGEFQVDICQQDTRIPDETLFFRWLPFIELNYPKELVIPNAHQGHKSEFVKVKVSGEEWALNCGADLKVRPIESNFYQIELRPEENTIRFSITKKGKPETNTKFQTTIPRLKWKTSKHETWNGKLQNIKRDELISGESFYLLVCPNDSNNKYDLSAILETNGQGLQEGKFIRQGINYNLELNQFYDTIKRNKNEIILKIKIWKVGGKLVSNVEVLQFPAEFEFTRKKPRKNIQQEKTMPIFSYPMVKAGLGEKRRGKGFSRQEIIAIGIDRSNIRHLNMPFDQRRKSSHDWNIKTLKSIIEGGKHAH